MLTGPTAPFARLFIRVDFSASALSHQPGAALGHDLAHARGDRVGVDNALDRTPRDPEGQLRPDRTSSLRAVAISDLRLGKVPLAAGLRSGRRAAIGTQASRSDPPHVDGAIIRAVASGRDWAR
jgi:hypothetical protein